MCSNVGTGEGVVIGHSGGAEVAGDREVEFQGVMDFEEKGFFDFVVIGEGEDGRNVEGVGGR